MARTDNQLRIEQLRKISGFTRPMSVFDAFIYNFLTMGVIFPWVYLWGPASFPGGNVEVAILLALAAQIPVSLAYMFLATALPVTGGDYVYQTRAFGSTGFVVVMSGFVVWILQWVALSGWLLCTLGLAPLCMALGVHFRSLPLTRAGVWIENPIGVCFISLFLALLTTVILSRGMRMYVKLQKLLFGLTLAAIAGVVYVFLFQADLNEHINSFVGVLIGQLHMSTTPNLSTNFVREFTQDVSSTGVNLRPAFSWIGTLGIVPIAWTSLQWATYSVEQNTEIENADKISAQLLILVGSALAVAFCLVLVAHAEHLSLSKDFVAAVSQAYWAEKGSATSVALVKTVLQPFPNVLAIAGSSSIFLSIVIALGFIANSFQVTCNSFIGVSRILVQMGTDGCLPRGLASVDPVRHAPTRALWVYFIASVPVIAGYSLVPSWSTYTLGVTFACGYVFMMSCVAATRLTSPRLRVFLKASEAYRIPEWIITSVSMLACLMSGAMVLTYLLVPQLGITGDIPYLVVAVIIVASYITIVVARRNSPLLDKNLRSVPTDESSFFEDEDEDEEVDER